MIFVQWQRVSKSKWLLSGSSRGSLAPDDLALAASQHVALSPVRASPGFQAVTMQMGPSGCFFFFSYLTLICIIYIYRVQYTYRYGYHIFFETFPFLMRFFATPAQSNYSQSTSECSGPCALRESSNASFQSHGLSVPVAHHSFSTLLCNLTCNDCDLVLLRTIRSSWLPSHLPSILNIWRNRPTFSLPSCVGL